MAAEAVPLDRGRLSSVSQIFAARLFQRFPELERYARMEAASEGGAFDLLVEIPSPTGDPGRQVVAWVVGGDEPSVGFGEWHTHSGDETAARDPTGEADAIVGVIEGILADQVVLIYDVGGKTDGDCGVVDLRDQDILLHVLTSPRSPGRVKIKSWSGHGDREVGLEDLSLD